MTGNPFPPGVLPAGHVQGIATRSQHKIKAVAHIVVQADGAWRTWCTGAAGQPETPLGDPCPRCLALLRQYQDEFGDGPQTCTCGTIEHPEYGTCRAPDPDCPVHKGS